MDRSVSPIDWEQKCLLSGKSFADLAEEHFNQSPGTPFVLAVIGEGSERKVYEAHSLHRHYMEKGSLPGSESLAKVDYYVREQTGGGLTQYNENQLNSYIPTGKQTKEIMRKSLFWTIVLLKQTPFSKVVQSLQDDIVLNLPQTVFRDSEEAKKLLETVLTVNSACRPALIRLGCLLGYGAKPIEADLKVANEYLGKALSIHSPPPVPTRQPSKKAKRPTQRENPPIARPKGIPRSTSSPEISVNFFSWIGEQLSPGSSPREEKQKAKPPPPDIKRRRVQRRNTSTGLSLKKENVSPMRLSPRNVKRERQSFLDSCQLASSASEDVTLRSVREMDSENFPAFALLRIWLNLGQESSGLSAIINGKLEGKKIDFHEMIGAIFQLNGLKTKEKPRSGLAITAEKIEDLASAIEQLDSFAADQTRKKSLILTLLVKNILGNENSTTTLQDIQNLSKEILKCDRSNLLACVQLGQLKIDHPSKPGDVKKGVVLLNRAKVIDPKNCTVLYALAKILRKDHKEVPQDLCEAEKLCRTILEIDASHVGARELLEDTSRNGDTEGPLQLCKRALQENPGDFFLLLRKADLLMNRSPEEAKQILEALYKENPTNPALLIKVIEHTMQSVRESIEAREKAVEYLQKLEEASQEKETILKHSMTLAEICWPTENKWVLASKKKKEPAPPTQPVLAKKLFEVILQADPRNVYAMSRLGDLLSTGAGEVEAKFQNALGLLITSNRLAPEDIYTLLALAEAYKTSGSEAEAKTLFATVLKLDPENQFAKQSDADVFVEIQFD